MANERHRRTDPVFQAALDKARYNSERTAQERAAFDRANMLPRVLAALAGPAAAAGGAALGGALGGVPGAALGAQTGGAGGGALAAILRLLEDEGSQGLRRQEAEQSGQSQVVQTLLR